MSVIGVNDPGSLNSSVVPTASPTARPTSAPTALSRDVMCPPFLARRRPSDRDDPFLADHPPPVATANRLLPLDEPLPVEM